jgi:putative membrane protein
MSMSGTHAHVQMLSLTLVITGVLVLTAVVYVRGWLCLRKAFPELIAGWRLAAFISGLFLVWIAVASPLAALDHRSLTIHMMKHLMLMTVAAPLLLAGAPAFPLVCGFPRLFIKSDRPFGSWSARWLERALMRPVLCWLAGTTAVIGWHLPAAFQLGMRSHWVHSLEDGTFLLAGLLFWWPIIAAQPLLAETRFNEATLTTTTSWSVPLYLFMATLPCDILGAFLVFGNRLVYPHYLSAMQLVSLSPLQDQETAGALMWVWVTFAYLIPAFVITVQLLSPQTAYASAPARATPAAPSMHGSEAEVL